MPKTVSRSPHSSFSDSLLTSASIDEFRRMKGPLSLRGGKERRKERKQEEKTGGDTETTKQRQKKESNIERRAEKRNERTKDTKE